MTGVQTCALPIFTVHNDLKTFRQQTDEHANNAPVLDEYLTLTAADLPFLTTDGTPNSSVIYPLFVGSTGTINMATGDKLPGQVNVLLLVISRRDHISDLDAKIYVSDVRDDPVLNGEEAVLDPNGDTTVPAWVTNNLGNPTDGVDAYQSRISVSAAYGYVTVTATSPSTLITLYDEQGNRLC